MSFLRRIRPAKEAEVRELLAAQATTEPHRLADQPMRDFASALQGGDRLIAEIKHKSPSHPHFQQFASPATLARAYQRNGAAALSIVTDSRHFGTSLADVAPVKAAVSLPVLVKDFVIDPSQLTAAWAAGADAALLIVRMLDEQQLPALLRHARGLGLQVLVECHDEADINRALKAKARLIGVNNRNLASLTTDLANGAALMPSVPRPALRVSESGLYSRADIVHMAQKGADAFLVGHALLQSRDPGRKVSELCGREAETRRRVKTCGLTSAAAAQMAHEAGADFLGLIFAPGPRQVSPATARDIRQAVPRARLCGVFVDQDVAHIAATAETCELDLIQLHGQESPAICRAVAQATGLPLIKALAPDQATPDQAAAYETAYLLVDLPKGPEKRGLTPADCRGAVDALSQAGFEVFLAGGLTPQDVRTAAGHCHPFAVDVASGIESAPGVKNPELTRQFITEATQ